MSYNYKSLEEFEGLFPFLSGGSPRDIRLFIIGEDKPARSKACRLVKKVLEGMLGSDKKEKKIKNYRVRVVDIANKSGQIFVERVYNLPKKDVIIVPIIENADGAPHLPQWFFDRTLPVVFCVSQKGYSEVYNCSKRDCYNALRI